MATAVQATAAPARVEAFLADQPKARRVLLEAAAALLDAGLPGARKGLKWGYPTWTGNGNVAALLPYPDHVNLQLFQGTRIPDPQRRLEGAGVTMRHVKLRAAKDLKDPALKALVRHAWRIDQQ